LTPLRIPTSIRSERRALAAFGVVSAIAVGALALVVILGDQRRIEVTLAVPSDGDAVPSTIREVALTFSAQPDHEAVEAAFSIEPPLDGLVRWRGRTLVYAFAGAIPVGDYRVSVEPGSLGRGSEPLKEAFELSFSVREPGIALVVTGDGRDELIELRPGEEARVLAAAPRIIQFAVSPDGRDIAVVTGDADGRGGLALVPLGDGPAQSLVETPDISIGGVAWAADSSALLVIRRDRLPDGGEGVPRAWLLRRSGEFIAPLDPEGNPSLSPAWSPDGQWLAYVSPSDARVIVANLTTEERQDLGQPRAGAPVWSADSTMVAWEAIAPGSASNPAQPIRVRSLDGSLDRTFGVSGEVRSAPRFYDLDTLVSLRRNIGVNNRGTELVFESISDGSLKRAIQIAGGPDLVLAWDLSPSRTKVVYAVRTAQTFTAIELDLESGDKREIEVAGDSPRWVP